jgi:ferrous iron transport protein A
MVNSLAVPRPPDVATDKPVLVADAQLASVGVRQKVRVVDLSQDREVAAWLRAVGLREGAEITVLRRAPFGGPIHVRTSDGGEFALNRDLARSVAVSPLPEDPDGNAARGRTG